MYTTPYIRFLNVLTYTQTRQGSFFLPVSLFLMFLSLLLLLSTLSQGSIEVGDTYSRGALYMHYKKALNA